MELGKQNAAPRTIVSQFGYLSFTNGNRDLIFDLTEGEIHEFDNQNSENYRRVAFKTQRIIISDVANDFEESGDDFRTDREKSAQQMLADIRQWETGIKPYRDKIAGMVNERLARLLGDSIPVSRDRKLPDLTALSNLARDTDSDSRIMSREVEGIKSQQKLIASFMVEVHKKYSIPTACIIFALIGAPLGMLARRGSMGISIGISLGLFVVYWAFLIGGEDLADRQIIAPFWAMWSANILIGLAGLYLIYIVSTEKPLWTLFRVVPFGHKGRP